MKIENQDIEALIDVSQFLKDLTDHPEDCRYKKDWSKMREHVRKVYIMLLQASSKGTPGIERLIQKGIDDGTPTAEAIRRLCPLTN